MRPVSVTDYFQEKKLFEELLWQMSACDIISTVW